MKSTPGQFGKKRKRSSIHRGVALERLEARELFVVGAFQVPAPIAPGAGYDGVVQTAHPGGGCSGTLLSTGQHVLTAAHCVDDDGDGRVDAGLHQVQFDMPSGPVPITATRVSIPATWQGDFTNNDIAVLELACLAPSGPNGAERFEIQRTTDEVGKTMQIVGYGQTGTGYTGASQPGGAKRSGLNVYLDGNETVLRYKFGKFASEGFIGPGDSGGPNFLNGKIAGVNSYVKENRIAGGDPEFEFDEWGHSTRVSKFTNWIDATIGGQRDVVLDMATQAVGNDGNLDVVQVRTAPNSSGAIEILVNAKVYHSESMANVRSLTLLGSGDPEKFILSQPHLLTVNINGRGGMDTLSAPNTGNYWDITGLDRGRLGARVAFSSVEGLMGGAGNDYFRFYNGAGVSGQIKGGGGTDTLDYSRYNTSVNVNLFNHTATRTGSVWGVENVIGGKTHDVLVGDNGDNRLVGGGGADQLHGLGGSDVLDGGDDYWRDQLWGGSGSDTFLQHWIFFPGFGTEDSMEDAGIGDLVQLV